MQYGKKMAGMTVAGVCMLMLTGCFNSVPKCSDEQVVQTLDEMLRNNMLLEMLGKGSVSMGIDRKSIRTVGVDDKTGMRTCKVNMQMKTKKNASKNDADIAAAVLLGMMQNQTLTYTVTKADDGENFYVEIVE